MDDKKNFRINEEMKENVVMVYCMKKNYYATPFSFFSGSSKNERNGCYWLLLHGRK